MLSRRYEVKGSGKGDEAEVNYWKLCEQVEKVNERAWFRWTYFIFQIDLIGALYFPLLSPASSLFSYELRVGVIRQILLRVIARLVVQPKFL